MSRTEENLAGGLQLVDSLMSLELAYTDPPLESDREKVKALRGGAIVLLVSTFEEYLKQRTQDAVKYLNSHLHDQEIYDFDKLPKRLVINHYHLAIKFASEGNKYDGLKPEERIPAILKAAIEIPAKRLDHVAFSQTHSNPNSNTLKQLFNDLGLKDVLRYLRLILEAIMGRPVAETYIEDTLDRIISLRNQASHAISTMNVSRSDMSKYRDFILSLCRCVDTAYVKYCGEILEGAKRTP